MKPRLFLDIDGVIYAHYGGHWQIRPYVCTLTEWAKEHFDLYWVSFNSRKCEIVKIIYASGIVADWSDVLLDERGYRIPAPRFWHPKADEAEKLHAIHLYGGLEGEWFLIEDTPPTLTQTEILKDKGMLHRWIVVPDTGSDVLLDVKFVLERYLKDQKLIVPFDWVRPMLPERDLCSTAVWKGYGEPPR